MMSEEKASNPHTKRGLVVGAAARVTLVVAAALAALIALPRAREPPHVYHRRGRPTQELVPR